MDDRKIYKCECGYVTHFEKALEAHCRFRHHNPLTEKPTVNEEKKTVIKKTRKPRAKKTVEKE